MGERAHHLLRKATYGAEWTFVGDPDVDDYPTEHRCECGSGTFRLSSTGDYELTAECSGCGLKAVVYDG